MVACEDQRLSAELLANKSHAISNSVISTGSEPQDSVPKSRKSCCVADYHVFPISSLWLVPCSRTGLVCGKTLVPIGYNLTEGSRAATKRASHCHSLKQLSKEPGDESLKEGAMQPKPWGQGRFISSIHAPYLLQASEGTLSTSSNTSHLPTTDLCADTHRENKAFNSSSQASLAKTLKPERAQTRIDGRQDPGKAHRLPAYAA